MAGFVSSKHLQLQLADISKLFSSLILVKYCGTVYSFSLQTEVED